MLNVNVWGGSELKVSAELIPYFTSMVGAGVSMRLRAAQIIKLIEGGSNSSGYGFKEEEGYEHNELREKYPNLCMITDKSGKLELRLVRNNQRFTKIHAKKTFEPVEAVYYNIDKEYITLDKNKNYKILIKNE